MPGKLISDLLYNYFNNTASAAEQEELSVLLADLANEERIREVMEEMWNKFDKYDQLFNSEKSKAILERIMKVHLLRSKHNVVHLWRRVAVAASIILVISITSYLLFWNKTSNPNPISRISN